MLVDGLVPAPNKLESNIVVKLTLLFYDLKTAKNYDNTYINEPMNYME